LERDRERRPGRHHVGPELVQGSELCDRHLGFGVFLAPAVALPTHRDLRLRELLEAQPDRGQAEIVEVDRALGLPWRGHHPPPKSCVSMPPTAESAAAPTAESAAQIRRVSVFKPATSSRTIAI